MPLGDLELRLRLTADGRNFVTEVRRGDQAMQRFEGSLDKAAGATRRLDRAQRSASGGLRGWLQRINQAHGRTLRYLGLLVGGGSLVHALQAVTRRLVESGVRLEGWEARLRSALGSAEAATREIAFLRQEAERLGLPFTALADNFSLFAAATRGTRLEGEATREVFVAVAEAARVMQLDTNQLNGVMNALTQIVSKGTVTICGIDRSAGGLSTLIAPTVPSFTSAPARYIPS